MTKLDYRYEILEERRSNNDIIYKAEDSIYDKIVYLREYASVDSGDWELLSSHEDKLRDLKNSGDISDYFGFEDYDISKKKFYEIYDENHHYKNLFLIKESSKAKTDLDLKDNDEKIDYGLDLSTTNQLNYGLDSDNYKTDYSLDLEEDLKEKEKKIAELNKITELKIREAKIEAIKEKNRIKEQAEKLKQDVQKEFLEDKIKTEKEHQLAMRKLDEKIKRNKIKKQEEERLEKEKEYLEKLKRENNQNIVKTNYQSFQSQTTNTYNRGEVKSFRQENYTKKAKKSSFVAIFVMIIMIFIGFFMFVQKREIDNSQLVATKKIEKMIKEKTNARYKEKERIVKRESGNSIYRKAKNSQDMMMYKEATLLFTKGCNLNHIKSCEYAGYNYQFGKGVNKNFIRANEFFDKACELKSGYSCMYLAFNYRKGQGVVKDINKAFKLFKKACNYKDDYACNEMGDYHRDGIIVSKNRDKAISYYDKSCKFNYALGCANLGYQEEQKSGIEKALVSYTKACRLKNGWSCSRLGDIYSKKNDNEKAINYYSKACKLKFKGSCGKLKEKNK